MVNSSERVYASLKALGQERVKAILTREMADAQQAMQDMSIPLATRRAEFVGRQRYIDKLLEVEASFQYPEEMI